MVVLAFSSSAHALSDLQQLPPPPPTGKVVRQPLPDLTEAPRTRPTEADDAAGDEPPTTEPVTEPVAPDDEMHGSEELPFDEPAATEAETDDEAEEAQGAPDDEAVTGPTPSPAAVEILTDLSQLPEPARRMRELIVEAAETGDVEALRPLLGTGPNQTQLSIGAVEGDPIEFLKEASGDDEGQEILAILIEILNAGFVRVDAGTDREIYLWPYFAAVPLNTLTDAQRVDLFKIITAGDFQSMRDYGSYLFYRAGITPEGEWKFFVAGD